jgi:glyoxylase-like metal-dependent hydrolase (beta-lactamase superfamily II)
MNIFAIETGKVKITQSWQVGRGDGVRRMLNTLFDRRFTQWLPIYVWVIEHLEGLIVIDTGISADANKRIWFPPFMPLIQRAARFDITPDQEIGPQLHKLGFSPEDVRWVLLTHLHQDHDGGLGYFPKAEFVVSEQEWHAASGRKGRMNGYLNQRWPGWFKPSLVNFDKAPFGPFSSHHPVTKSGDVHLVSTPGHSPGHLSVIVQEGERSIFFAGDASYTQDLLITQKADGIGADPQAQRETHSQILQYAQETPTVYLPSHDPDAKARLEKRMPIAPQEVR